MANVAASCCSLRTVLALTAPFELLPRHERAGDGLHRGTQVLVPPRVDA